MNLKELQRILKNSTEEHIAFDEPHFTQRCKENNLTKEKVKHILLYEFGKLSYILEDRKNVYKIYFKLSNKRQLKLVIDLLQPKRIMIRTVRILDRKLYRNIKLIKRKRY